MDPVEFSWQVPGLRAELVTEMIRSLPKALRRDLVPAPDVAREVLARLGEPSGDLRDALGRELRAMRGVTVPRDAWDLAKLPPHLRITFRVLADDEPAPAGAPAAPAPATPATRATPAAPRVLASGDDLAALQRQLRPRLRAKLSAAADIVRSGLTSWNFDSLPEVFKDGTVVAYPALVDAGETVGVRLFESPAAARTAMRAGTRRLILLSVPSPVKSIAGGMSTQAKLALSHNPHGGVAAMFADCVSCATDFLITQAGGPVRDRAAFDELRNSVRGSLHDTTGHVVRRVEGILRLRGDPVRAAADDMRAQLSRLIYPGFITAAGYRRLPDLARYLQGMERRLSKLPENPGRDAVSMVVAQRVEQAYQQAIAAFSVLRRGDDDVTAIRWMLEELRISLFAQTLGTPIPVSENRVLAAITRLTP
jgi:ATP-dependent helicase HrpA